VILTIAYLTDTIQRKPPTGKLLLRSQLVGMSDFVKLLILVKT